MEGKHKNWLDIPTENDWNIPNEGKILYLSYSKGDYIQF